ncbi:MAG TPA: glycan-binding surface protein [Cyclobacteriaceae bacterium]|nr:glycan-binding surface protein [Cyclobacteriaceae bacterium]
MMKPITKHIKLLVFLLSAASALFMYSCSEENLENNGDPIIYYIRNTDPERSDSLYVGAPLGNLIAIVGDNLGGTNKIMFNDQEAVLNTTYVTDKSILINVPPDAPIVRNDKMILTFRNGETLEYDFKVDISAPLVESMENEWAQEGETALIRGNYFFEPLTVKFADGTTITTSSISQTAIAFEVPAGAPEGPITVATNFGTTESVFHFHDNRNIVLNYDNLTSTGSWRYGLFVQDEHSLDGKYVKFKGTYNAGERNEGSDGPSTYESAFWAQRSGRPEGNFLPGEPGDFNLKFEVKIIGWSGSLLNICWAPWNWVDSNQELWSNTLNARAVWGPTPGSPPVDTDGKWVTVVIPMTEFRWAMGMSGGNVTYTEAKFDKKVTGSMSLWVLSAPGAADSPFEFYIDNIRVVPNK